MTKTSIRRLSLDWMNHGLCVGDDLDAYFADTVSARTKSICRTCSVQLDCLEWALLTDERYGVWGGAIAVERERLTKLIGYRTAREVAESFITAQEAS